MVELADLSGAELVIPYHNDRHLEETHNIAQAIGKILESQSKARLLDIQHGKWYEIGVQAAELP